MTIDLDQCSRDVFHEGFERLAVSLEMFGSSANEPMTWAIFTDEGDEDHDDRLHVADGSRQWAEMPGFPRPTRF